MWLLSRRVSAWMGDKFLDGTHRNIAANREKLKHFNQLAFTCVRIVKRKSAEED